MNPEPKGYTVAINCDVTPQNEVLHQLINPWQEWKKSATSQDIDPLTDTIEVIAHLPEGSMMSLSDPETGAVLGSGGIERINFRIPAKFSISEQGLVAFVGFGTVRLPVGRWEEIYRPDLSISELMAFIESEPDKPKKRRKRPPELAQILPIDGRVTWPAQTHLSGMMLDVASSKADSWKYHSIIDGFALETKHGKALVTNTPFEVLNKLLDLGPAVLQYTVAALHHITTTQKRKHGNSLPAWEELTPTRLGCSELLRSMGKNPGKYSGFTRKEQWKAGQMLDAADRLQYMDIKPTHDSQGKINYGPLVNVLNTEMALTLPFDDGPDRGEVLAVDVMPGKAIWEDICKHGLNWFHPQLLRYDAKDEKFEILIGFYLGQQQINKRNKPNQNYISLETIERESGIVGCDSNPRRRTLRIEKALNRLARDGVIPARAHENGQLEAMIGNPKADKAKKLSAADARRAQIVWIKDPPTLPEPSES